MNQLIRQSTISVQKHRDSSRLWLEGKYLENAGFHKGSFISVSFKKNQIIVRIDPVGTKVVSAKKTGPVIDIDNQKISKVFNVSEKIHVIVETGRIIFQRTKSAIRKASAVRNGKFGSVFSSGGLLDLAASIAELKESWGIEICEKFANVWQKNYDAPIYNMDIADINYDDLEKVQYLILGIPCEVYSKLRKVDDRKDDPNSDLSMFVLMLIEHLNPRTIILEEVPFYLKTDIGKATVHALQRMGYTVESRLYCGQDFGMLETRTRAVIVASYDKIVLPNPEPETHYAKEILHDPQDSKCKWFDESSKPWLFKSWKNHKENNRNFIAKEITGESTSIPAITKRYQNIQPSNPLVKHPTKEGTYRLFTIEETKKIKGVPEDYYLGETKEVQGNILGQGVLVKLFGRIISSIVGGVQ